jgi:hypothetical protein
MAPNRPRIPQSLIGDKRGFRGEDQGRGRVDGGVIAAEPRPGSTLAGQGVTWPTSAQTYTDGSKRFPPRQDLTTESNGKLAGQTIGLVPRISCIHCVAPRNAAHIRPYQFAAASAILLCCARPIGPLSLAFHIES